MATPQDFSSQLIRRFRLLIGDRQEPYYYSDEELYEFYVMEMQDLYQGCAAALESWASEISYDEGGYSAGGVSVNSQAMAADKQRRAGELRMRMVRA